MAKARYIVELTSEERYQLKQLISKGRVAAYKQLHGRVLLLADQGPHGGKKMSGTAIAHALNCGKVTVERIRKRFVERGLERAIRAYEQAVELTPPDSPELPGHLFNLGNGLSYRYT